MKEKILGKAQYNLHWVSRWSSCAHTRSNPFICSAIVSCDDQYIPGGSICLFLPILGLVYCIWQQLYHALLSSTSCNLCLTIVKSSLCFKSHMWGWTLEGGGKHPRRRSMYSACQGVIQTPPFFRMSANGSFPFMNSVFPFSFPQT